ncbi:uncharacterized protein BT62DRAFT_935263 [Guyanagaster necrorhizus]|uniref:Uncharacterized protein n=1 Tax=Guyanagaster necrorhizus TaxID=856835 RepID=A0A9P7VMS3_9AGAR|nr:uncharacterized protein BT62DRAFT_935263 [Guyanagaster necrorhizus MCA 3950]KAG7443322.1 hypothetical protein BT62DRAFT_935263 [Guyanagaster necrorhizus MCA 3950]
MSRDPFTQLVLFYSLRITSPPFINTLSYDTKTLFGLGVYRVFSRWTFPHPHPRSLTRYPDTLQILRLSTLTYMQML